MLVLSKMMLNTPIFANNFKCSYCYWSSAKVVTKHSTSKVCNFGVLFIRCYCTKRSHKCAKLIDKKILKPEIQNGLPKITSQVDLLLFRQNSGQQFMCFSCGIPVTAMKIN